MDGWLIGVPAPEDSKLQGETWYFAAWIVEEAAAIAAVTEHLSGRPHLPPAKPHAVEPLAATALRTMGAAPGKVVAVPTPSG